jgi:regulator of extracellular matrix RemA (YlzA/DUF370 family)
MNDNPNQKSSQQEQLCVNCRYTPERRHAEQRLLNVGFGSTVVADRVVSILTPNSAPIRRLKDEAREERRLLDATYGRKTRSVIILDSNHIILSAIQAETISQRFTVLGDAE